MPVRVLSFAWVCILGLNLRTYGAEMSFSNQTEPASISAVHTPSIWLEISQLNVSTMISGGAVGDFNNDGYQDILVLTGGEAPDELYINNGDGTFSEQAEAWGVSYAHMGVGSAVGDYDKDGDIDIFVTSLGPATAPTQPGHHLLYRNNGDGTFTNVAAEAGVETTSLDIADGFGAAFGDYDLDGDLDLMVVGWVTFSGGNVLFQNNGDGTFTNVTAQANLSGLADCRGFSTRFVDMNGDHYPEILIAADFLTSRYLINNGDGTFTDFTAESGTGLDGNGMGHAVGDFDGDGLLDWYVTSIYSQNSYLPGVPGTGNMLYMNEGDHIYAESSVDMGCNDGGWGWGTDAVDVDHDGLLDIVETNGWSQANGPAGPEWVGESCYLFWNVGNGFINVADTTGIDHDGQGRGLATLDYDNDGDRDLLVFGYNEPLALFRNDLSGSDANWLRVVVDTSNVQHLAPDGFGSMVTTITGGYSQVRSINGGNNYLVQSELSAHFGVGSASVIDELRVDFYDGTFTRMCNVQPNQSIVVLPLLADLDGNGTVTIADLLALIGAWGPCSGCPADVDGDGQAGITDLLILIAEWGTCTS